MKAIVMGVMLAIVAMLTTTEVSASVKKTVYNNDTVENGRVVAREICAEEDGVMTLVFRSEMEYTEEGKLSIKRDFVWNRATSEWKLDKSYTYEYSLENITITVVDSKGNTKVIKY